MPDVPGTVAAFDRLSAAAIPRYVEETRPPLIRRRRRVRRYPYFLVGQREREVRPPFVVPTA
ncbi:MAG: hypothetical protein J4N27_03175, partial [Chloroflexi bacterium]|nr:hypothetical protein [Chloroflexota bacterium]